RGRHGWARAPPRHSLLPERLRGGGGQAPGDDVPLAEHDAAGVHGPCGGVAGEQPPGRPRRAQRAAPRPHAGGPLGAVRARARVGRRRRREGAGRAHLEPRRRPRGAVSRAGAGGGALVAELGDARRRGRQRRPCRPHGGGGGGHPAGRRAASLSGIPRAPGGGCAARAWEG
ncbi:unnamed protein product, partial [Prorocentrum cordatum]